MGFLIGKFPCGEEALAALDPDGFKRLVYLRERKLADENETFWRDLCLSFADTEEPPAEYMIPGGSQAGGLHKEVSSSPAAPRLQ